MGLHEPAGPEFAYTSSPSGHQIRRLGEHDLPEMEAFLATQPGYSLFLTANLSYLHLSMELIRYWGSYTGERLAAVLMMVGRRAMICSEPESTELMALLAQIAVQHQMDFTMGQPQCVDALLAASGRTLSNRREHYLAEHGRGAASNEKTATTIVPVPPGALVRRAELQDLEGLTALYYRTEGFELLGRDQLRRVLSGRIRGLRTWVAEVNGLICSAASTSAESRDAAMIGGVWTAPEMRNRGLSRVVVSALSRELHDEGRRTFLFYRIDNTAAAQVYLHAGYSRIGRWSVAQLYEPGPGE
jgi:predicted GNAT family acetyltransferase